MSFELKLLFNRASDQFGIGSRSLGAILRQPWNGGEILVMPT